MSRRPGAALVAVLCTFGLVLAACSDDKKANAPSGGSSGSSSATGTAGPGSSGEPQTGGTLRVGIQRPRSLDPAAASPGSQSELLVADLLFDGLSAPGADGEPAVPALATWTVPSDLKTWTFKLRTGATFANGRAITAADAKYSLERVAKRGEGALAAVRLGLIVGFAEFLSGATPDLAGLKAVDATTLEVDLAAPLADLPEL